MAHLNIDERFRIYEMNRSGVSVWGRRSRNVRKESIRFLDQFRSGDCMKKQRVKVTQELKERILEEALQASCNISALAKRHNLSVKTISKWRIAYRRQEQESTQHLADKFIEITSLPVIDKTSGIKKVELTFDEYSCSIVGKINSSQLLKLVQLLEGGLC